MNVNDGKWFHIKEREGKEMYAGMNLTDREKNDLILGELVEAVPNDTVVVNKKTGEKMILITTTSTDESDYYLAVNKDGDLVTGSVKGIKLLLSNEQKKLLE